MKQSLSSAFDAQLLTAMKQIRKIPILKTNHTINELYQRLTKLVFWCGDNTLHERFPATYQESYCCLTHVVGLPRQAATNQLLPLTPYQVEFFDIVNNAKKRKNGETEIDALRNSHKFHINKGRQMGFTEIVLRVMQYYCFHDYEGHKVGIIAATNGSLAKKDLRRFVRLFFNIKPIVKEWGGNTATLINDTKIEAFKASEEAMTGDTGYKCIMMDEAAKWRVIDDTPIFNSVVPIVNMNGADFFLISTPKGPIKMFYDIHKVPKDYIKIENNIYRTVGNLYTAEQVQHMINNAKEDPEQEYLCGFTFGKDAVFGKIGDELHMSNEDEWDNTNEDDGYSEDNTVSPDLVWGEK